jgi:DNA-binding NarL/FixJ family response regulator
VADTPRSPRVVIADDDEGFAASLASLLEADGRVEVIGIAADGEEALQLAVWQDPDVVVMDVAMPGIDGIEVTRLVRESKPRVCILMVSGTESVELRDKAHSAGAAGFLHKSQIRDEIVDAIVRLAAGEGAGDNRD